MPISGLIHSMTLELHKRQRIMDLVEVTCNLTGQWLTANVLNTVKAFLLHFNIWTMKKIEKGIPG